MKLNRILAVCTVAAALIITSCKKDDNDDDGGNGPETGTIEFEFEHEFAGDQFHLNHVFVSENDDSLTFTTFKYYISNIILINSQNEEYKVPDSYHLLDAGGDVNTIKLTAIPKGDYKSFKFIIGVDSTRNVSGDQVGALDPINSMFWSWNTGYKFVKVEGTSPQAEPNNTFIFHVGGFKTPNSAIKEVTLTSNDHAALVKANASPQVHIKVDIAEFFTNPATIDISTTNDVQMPGAMAAMLATNYADMFTLDHIHN